MSFSILRAGVLALAAFSLSLPALAHEFEAGNLEIVHPWSRATPAGAKVAGGFFKVENKGDTPDRLLSVGSDIAEKVQVHEMTMTAEGMASMNEVTGGIEIAPGATLELKPGSYHVMFIGLKHPLVEGEKFKGTLTFEKAGTVEVDFVVGPLGGTSGHGTMQ
ncbi:copper chaperone PCu(A)C [Zavarzinia sp.]|uniref:copper chaperone PCu(A)C n=1 Tax=Zavarzinia sp. TaxID=2027920 RepID=UPI003BB7EF07